MPAFIEDLEKAITHGCQSPGCTHEDHGTLFLHGRCHLDADVEVSYTKDSGEVLVACAVCKLEIARIAVARRDPPPISKN
jgi:hypothetical protein